jgi:hypothetical protein
VGRLHDKRRHRGVAFSAPACLTSGSAAVPLIGPSHQKPRLRFPYYCAVILKSSRKVDSKFSAKRMLDVTTNRPGPLREARAVRDDSPGDVSERMLDWVLVWMAAIGVTTLGVTPMHVYIFPENTPLALFSVILFFMFLVEVEGASHVLLVLGATAYPIAVLSFLSGVVAFWIGSRTRLLFTITLFLLICSTTFLLFFADPVDWLAITFSAIAALAYGPALFLLAIRGARERGEDVA